MIFILLRHDVLLYVNYGCGLNNCYSIKCNKQQEQGQRYVLKEPSTKLESDQIGPDWLTDWITDRITESKKKIKNIKSFMS